MAAKLKRCTRCNRRVRSGADWAVSIDSIDDHGFGVVAELYCPRCTTDEEHLRREINDSTCDYVWVGVRVAMLPKFPETA